MAKITHEKLVKIYKGIGYIEYDVYPDADITVMCLHSGDEFELIVICGSNANRHITFVVKHHPDNEPLTWYGGSYRGSVPFDGLFYADKSDAICNCEKELAVFISELFTKCRRS